MDISNGVKMVIGLGNPGREYADTRHNIGFRVVDSLAQKLKIDVKKRKFAARFGWGESGDKKLILLKPWQFMNQSGSAVAKAMAFYKLSVGVLLVVSDDMALAVGAIRLRAKGSAGGHNGLADVIEKLGTDQFGRLRVGIGKSDRVDDVDYVLSRPSEKERLLLDKATERAQEAVLCWVEHGIETAMNEFNSA
ncbi:Peptidyl-tRNA hydrolase [subsurface metagenome]